ncbi:MAG: serine hydrolase domain-containing protein [Acidobacteriota bacterium]
MTRRILLLMALPLLGAEDYFPPPDAQGGWRRLATASSIARRAGMDLAKLDEAFAYAQGTAQHGGLLVVRHGYLLYEKYYGRGDREALPELASVGKAFTSAALGMAMMDKPAVFAQGLDERVWTPKLLPAEAFPVDDERKLKITLGQVLSMAAGIRGTNPVYVKGEKQVWENPTIDNGPWSTTDEFALRQRLWCHPGDCYSYSTASSHIPAIVVRHVMGMEMEEYLRRRLTGPLGFGDWGYAMYRPKLKSGIDAQGRMLHTPGGGSIAVRATDMLRFGYLFLKQGRWGRRQILPAEFVGQCGRGVSYNPHYTHSFNFNVNEDGHLAGAPRDAFWKGGAGGYAIYVVPSLDLVVWKLGGNEGQYDPALTRLPVRYRYDGSRADWKAPANAGDTTGKTLEMVIRAITP